MFNFVINQDSFYTLYGILPKLVHMIERHMIEGRSAEMIEENLKAAFDTYCE